MNSKDIKELASITDVYISAPDCLPERQWEQLVDGLIELKSQCNRLVQLGHETIGLLRDSEPDFCSEVELVIAELEGRIARSI